MHSQKIYGLNLNTGKYVKYWSEKSSMEKIQSKHLSNMLIYCLSP